MLLLEDLKVGDVVELKLLNSPYQRGIVTLIDGVFFIELPKGKGYYLKDILTNKAFTINLLK